MLLETAAAVAPKPVDLTAAVVSVGTVRPLDFSAGTARKRKGTLNNSDILNYLPQ